MNTLSASLLLAGIVSLGGAAATALVYLRLRRQSGLDPAQLVEIAAEQPRHRLIEVPPAGAL